jgi:starvation-inducible outer membrane lipoprotein
VAWNPVDSHLGIEGVDYEGDVIDCMGKFLARAAGEVGGADYSRLVISKEVYRAV